MLLAFFFLYNAIGPCTTQATTQPTFQNTDELTEALSLPKTQAQTCDSQ